MLRLSIRFATLTFVILSCIVLVCLPSVVWAKAKVVTQSDGIRVYSGPGNYYRPLAVLPAKTELRASSQIIKSKNGEFYRVLVTLSEKKSAIGFISTEADVRFIDDLVSEDDLEKFGEVALVSKARQLSYSLFADSQSMVTGGYMHYLSPGFYVKGFGGAFLAPGANAFVGGGEIGNDALLTGILSGYVAFAGGVFSPFKKETIFEGSSTLNVMMQALVGLRLNFSGVWSLSTGITQAVLFNANNSKVLNGANVTLEIGL